MADGLARGVRLFATETGKPLAGEPHPSFSNIQRAGFVIAYERANWTVWNPLRAPAKLLRRCYFPAEPRRSRVKWRLRQLRIERE